ncbi:hypothetical protein G6F59_018835 [Rhizopus arrhizus]|nr:hypothetical protein G6F59_018835 [Rhizopus arrhizus]
MGCQHDQDFHVALRCVALFVRADAHNALAGVFALQQPHQAARRILQPVDHVFAPAQLTFLDPLPRLAQEVVLLRVCELIHNESPQRDALGQDLAHRAGQAVRAA